jgi:ketosteroid isomerase-like protein
LGISEANLRAVRRALDAFYRGAVTEVEDLAGERFEFVEASDVPGAVRFGGEDWHADLMDHLGEVWEDPPGTFEAEGFSDVGHDVLVRGRLTLRGKASGIEVTNEIVILFEFSHGKLRRVSNYPSEVAARAAIQSPPQG